MADSTMQRYGNVVEKFIDMLDGTKAPVVAAAKTQQMVGTVVIANGYSISSAIDLGPYRAVGFSMPAAFSGTSLKFQSSFDGVTYNPVYKDGVEITETVGVSRRIVLDPAKFYGIRYLKLVSNQSEAADRTISIVAEC